MDEMFFGVTINDLRRLAYEFATANGIEHRFDNASRTAGRDWVESFLKRNDHLGLRQSAPISLARAIGFNRVQVEKFYNNLIDLYDKYNFQPNRIYNMDETGMSTVPKKTPKVVSVKGKKAVGKIVSAERGTTITAIMCMSATGHFIPPAFIYPRKKENFELIKEGPTQCICMVSDTGFVNTELFVNWLHHFKYFVHPTKEDPVLLILDNHSSHISLGGTEYAREHHIIMLTLPPHGSHKLQPLDVAVHSPLKTKYAIECEKWMNKHPGRGITQYQVATLFNLAYKHVATISNAESGFKATGIYPFANDLFDETDFAPSTVTDQFSSNLTEEVQRTSSLQNKEGDIQITVSRKDNEEDLNKLSQIEVERSHSVRFDVSDQTTNTPAKNKNCATPPESPSVLGHSVIQVNDNDIQLSATVDSDMNSDRTTMSPEDVLVSPEKKINKCSPSQEKMRAARRKLLHDEENIPSNSQAVTVAQLSPLPRMTERNKRKRQCLKSEIITGTPYKKQLEEKKKIEDKKKRKPLKNTKSAPLSFEPRPGTSGIKKKQSKKIKMSKINIKKEGGRKSYFCAICGEKYKHPPTEEWIQCSICERWFHEQCTAYETGTFTCDFCA